MADLLLPAGKGGQQQGVRLDLITRLEINRLRINFGGNNQLIDYSINLSPKRYRQKNNKNLLKKDNKSRKRFLLSKVTTSHNKCVIIASFKLHCVSKAKKSTQIIKNTVTSIRIME
jgi:hypothetical protein